MKNAGESTTVNKYQGIKKKQNYDSRGTLTSSMVWDLQALDFGCTQCIPGKNGLLKQTS